MGGEDDKDDAKTGESNEEAASKKSGKLSHLKWEDMFNRLVKYKKKHGDCLVPNRYPDDPQLGSWVSAQRRQYKTMISDSDESTPMTEERSRRLEKLGFQWNTKDPRHVPWDTRYKELKAFRQKYGHSQVPIGWTENVKLSNWVSTQRQEYKLMQRGRQSRLTKDRVDKLNEIEFVWEAQRGGPRRIRRAVHEVPPRAKPVEVASRSNLARPAWPGWPRSWMMGANPDASEAPGNDDAQKQFAVVPWVLMPGGMYQQADKTAGQFVPMAAPWMAGFVPNGVMMTAQQPPQASVNNESKLPESPDVDNVATTASGETFDDEDKEGDDQVQDSMHSLLETGRSAVDDSTDALDSKPESVDTKDSALM